MEKILPDLRRRVGDFEIIDWASEERLESMRNHLDVEAPVNVHWNWSYASDVEELRALYQKGKGAQWDATTLLDWSTPVSKDDWVMRPEASLLANLCKMAGKDEATQKAAAFDEFGFTISQLLHGEQAALQLCGQLTNVCEQIDQKLYAASQVIDEARHVEVFAKFMMEKIGTVYPIGGTLKTLLEILLQAEGAAKKTLGMQTLFEGMAVGIMTMLRAEARNPLIIEMIRNVENDEARHAAFGVLNMRRVVQQASRAEMEEMEDWAFEILEALNANAQLDMLKLFGPRYDIDPELTVRMLTSLENFAELNSIAYMHTVIPNLQRLGLLTERTEQQWRDRGMMIDRKSAAYVNPELNVVA